MKASSLVLAKDLELQPGTLLHSGAAWHLRVYLEELGKQYEGTVALTTDTPGEYHQLDYQSSCLALLPSTQLQARVIGDIQGPGVPTPGSLVWGKAGVSIAGFVRGPLFVGLNGLESDDVLQDKAFFATNWGIWIVDGNGEAVYEQPLLTVKAA